MEQIIPQLTLPNGILLLSYTIGYLIVNCFENILLNVGERGTQLRWTLSPKKPFLNQRKAKILALIQFLIPFIMALYIDDIISGILKITMNYLYPIVALTVASVYASATNDLPYKMTRPEKIGIISTVVISGVLIYSIYQYHWFSS